jgi:hypothetical protein
VKVETSQEKVRLVRDKISTLAVTPKGGKESDWHSLETHQVQFGDQITHGNALKVCGVQCQVLDHRLTRPKEESEVEEKDEEGREEEEEKRKKNNMKWKRVRLQ